MNERKLKHTYRELSPEEDARLKRMIDEAEREAPLVKRQVRQCIAAHERLREMVAALRAEREKQGVTLEALARKVDMDEVELKHLEEDAHAGPSVETVRKIAQALGKDVRIELVDHAA